jgi:hypothetical protein
LNTLLLPNLLLIGVSLCEVLELVVSFSTSPSPLKTDFICIFYCIFGFGGFTGSFLWEVLTSPYLIFYLSLILGFYGLHWIYIFLSFSKIPSFLKSESGCESYRVFRKDISGFKLGWTGISIGNQQKSYRIVFLYFRFWVRLDRVLDRESPEQVGNDPQRPYLAFHIKWASSAMVF